MSKHISAEAPLRALLTETLPYEVPAIFSNDKWFGLAALATQENELGGLIQKIFRPAGHYTIPYNYDIAKASGTTRLSIVHPQAQVKMAEFYHRHGRTLVANCAKSEFSLRRPIGIATAFVETTNKNADTGKKGLVETKAAPEMDEPENPTYISFFAYAKYNLLGKFIESSEFIGLEKKFSIMRSIDVNKCFYNIYTHTISWAVKSKDFAKENRNSYSFESEFDSLMQTANYNETNGIVVGPELSRVFAEIIFQDIDRKVYNLLKNSQFFLGRDYAIRRYVDDYFIFAQSDQQLSIIERILRDHLGEYKLYVNERKVRTDKRPFVSQISLARREIGNILLTLKADMNGIDQVTDTVELALKSKDIRRQIKELRLVVARWGVDLSALSGWILSAIKPLVVMACKGIQEREDGKVGYTLSILGSILGFIFYIVALDRRVRPTYNLCQILSIVMKYSSAISGRMDPITHLIGEELVLVIGSMVSPWRNEHVSDPIELFNLLICGAQYLGEPFLKQKTIREIMDYLLKKTDITYFLYVSLKFCYLKDKKYFSSSLSELNDHVRQRLNSEYHKLSRQSELFLLACDFVSAPDVLDSDARAVLKFLAPGDISNVLLKDMRGKLGFVDWEGLRIDHLLQRHELRPVYSWV